MDNKKIFTIIYALSIVGVVGALFMAIYNLTFAYSGVEMSGEIKNMFRITNILMIVMIALLVAIIVVNMFTKNKFFWLEIGFALLAIITTIILISLNKSGKLSTSAYIMVWFEIVSSCFMLILSRVCVFFLDRKKAKEAEIEENN